MKSDPFLYFFVRLTTVAAFAVFGSCREPLALLTLPDRQVIRVEVARTQRDRARGLMFRERLESDRGMLFVFDRVGERSMWMKNMRIGLDIIFLDGEGRIMSVKSHVPPAPPDSSDEQIPFVSAFGQYVLEIAEGEAHRHRLEPGQKIDGEPFVMKR